MNVFTVKFWLPVALDEEGKIIEGGVTSENDDNVEMSKMTGRIDIGAMDIGDAYLEAAEYLDQLIGEDGYNISSISEIEELNLINWPGEGEDCQCSYCRTERAADEDKITFSCVCQLEITIIDDFNIMECPKCGRRITRDRIIGSRSSGYTLMNIDGD